MAHTPQLDGLPRFVYVDIYLFATSRRLLCIANTDKLRNRVNSYNLAFKVDWTSEQLCFRDLAEELAFLYR